MRAVGQVRRRRLRHTAPPWYQSVHAGGVDHEATNAQSDDQEPDCDADLAIRYDPGRRHVWRQIPVAKNLCSRERIRIDPTKLLDDISEDRVTVTDYDELLCNLSLMAGLWAKTASFTYRFTRHRDVMVDCCKQIFGIGGS